MARAFVPGHITGIFRIHDNHEDPLHCGSIGAGFSIKAGTYTTIKVMTQPFFEMKIRYNGNNIDAPVTAMVIQKLVEDYETTMIVEAEHNSALPIGVGYGASGAGALSTALALGHILDNKMTIEKAARYAHIAEVVNHTGLGDVIAQVKGGLEIRRQPGAPGVGDVFNVPYPNSLHAILAGSPGLETRDVLTNPDHKARINEMGDDIMTELIADPTFEHFINCSRRFSKSIGLMTPRVEITLQELDDIGLNQSSMVMLGDAIFCLCNESEVQKAKKVLSKYWSESEVIETSLTDSGGRLL